MGSNLNPEDIKEGDDVYFECNIRANPKTYKLSWYHDVSSRPIVKTLIKATAGIYCVVFFNKNLYPQGVEIFHNVSAGVILSDQSLVLQSVTRATAGDFTCVATNSEGKGASNPVTLVVRCK